MKNKINCTYKAFNKYGYTTMTLKVDGETKTATLYRGMCAPLGYDVKTSKKAIMQAIDNFKAWGYDIIEK